LKFYETTADRFSEKLLRKIGRGAGPQPHRQTTLPMRRFTSYKDERRLMVRRPKAVSNHESGVPSKANRL
jgi:hypothetical protein